MKRCRKCKKSVQSTNVKFRIDNIVFCSLECMMEFDRKGSSKTIKRDVRKKHGKN